MAKVAVSKHSVYQADFRVHDNTAFLATYREALTTRKSRRDRNQSHIPFSWEDYEEQDPDAPAVPQSHPNTEHQLSKAPPSGAQRRGDPSIAAPRVTFSSVPAQPIHEPQPFQPPQPTPPAPNVLAAQPGVPSRASKEKAPVTGCCLLRQVLTNS
jgi:hypothetical protein